MQKYLKWDILTNSNLPRVRPTRCRLDLPPYSPTQPLIDKYGIRVAIAHDDCTIFASKRCPRDIRTAIWLRAGINDEFAVTLSSEVLRGRGELVIDWVGVFVCCRVEECVFERQDILTVGKLFIPGEY